MARKTAKPSTEPQKSTRYWSMVAVFCRVCGGGGKNLSRSSPGSNGIHDQHHPEQAKNTDMRGRHGQRNAAFRRYAAAAWGNVYLSLYTLCFTGKAKWPQRCDNCLSAAHKTSECHALGDEEPYVAGWVRAVEAALLVFSTKADGQGWRKCAGSLRKEVQLQEL